MVEETILQHPVFMRFILPFALMFFIVYAILVKTKVLGDDQKQLNALVALVIGLIFVGFTYPTFVATNLILFLTVAIIIMFVGLMLWGFLIGGEAKVEKPGLKWLFGIVIVIALILAVVWSTGFDIGVLGFLFDQPWSKSFWTNAAFIVVVAGAVAWVFAKAK